MVIKRKEKNMFPSVLLNHGFGGAKPVGFMKQKSLFQIIIPHTEMNGDKPPAGICFLHAFQPALAGIEDVRRKRKPFPDLPEIIHEIQAGNKMPFHISVVRNLSCLFGVYLRR